MVDAREGAARWWQTRWALSAGIVSWTMIAWGGRVGLLAGSEDVWAWARIGGSLATGLVAAAGLVLAPTTRWTSVALGVFSLWTVVIWSRSLVVTWLGSGSLPFKLVHAVLAVGFYALAWLAWRSPARSARS